jgi:DNA-binding GntR family transcriptional regulator
MRLAGKSSSPVPLYFKVMTEIRDHIVTGTWRRGFQLPGEMELARRRGVSVITVRQALSQLTQEGFVRRERARGTFVSWSGPVNQAIDLEIEADTLITLNLEGTSFKLLRTENLKPPEEIRAEFNLSQGDKITRITRTRLARGQALAYVHSYVLTAVAAKLSSRSLLTLPLSSAIESVLRITVSDVKHLVGAKLADDDAASHLGISPGSPVLFVKRFYFHRKNLLLLTLGFYRSDIFNYSLTLKRKKR